jgi:hypothetical protein
MCDAKTVEEKEAEEEKKRIREKIFWAKQQALAAEMAAQADSGVKRWVLLSSYRFCV